MSFEELMKFFIIHFILSINKTILNMGWNKFSHQPKDVESDSKSMRSSFFNYGGL